MRTLITRGFAICPTLLVALSAKDDGTQVPACLPASWLACVRACRARLQSCASTAGMGMLRVAATPHPTPPGCSRPACLQLDTLNQWINILQSVQLPFAVIPVSRCAPPRALLSRGAVLVLHAGLQQRPY